MDASPFKFQIKRKVDLVDNDTKQRIARKFKQMEESFKIKLAESIAPGQGKEFIDEFLNNSCDRTEDEIPDELKRSLCMYNKSDTFSKLVILLLSDHSKLTKEYIINVFHCTLYRIDLARKWHASSEPSGSAKM